MSNSAEALRRWLGMFCLAIATGMLIWGRTVLQSHLSGSTYLLYWAICAVIAFAAVGFGVADIWFARRALQAERQELSRATLELIRRNGEGDDDNRDAPTGR